MSQTTLAKKIKFSGIGLHSGQTVHMELCPAPINSGINFMLEHENKAIIKPNCELVSANGLATTLYNSNKQGVATVEHLLAAIRGMGIDNMLIILDANEVPIMDGSALYFVHEFEKTGLQVQNAGRKFLRLVRPITVVGDNKYIKASPANNFSIDYTIDFPHPAIQTQQLSMLVNASNFKQLAQARTFGFLKEVEYLHSKGLALGGDLNNAVVLDEHKVLNPEGLRSPNEFVQHKVLDFIGDMAVCELPILAHFEVSCSGHKHNNLFLQQLMKQADYYCEVINEANYQYQKPNYANPDLQIAYAF